MKERYRTQLVRDLHWALSSPMMMEHPLVVEPRWGQSETARYQGLLKKLDDRRSALARTVRNADVDRLGHYFEVLLRTWVDQVPPARLVASNWQAYSGRHTIGEYDLLFWRDATFWHWELALKFYLGHPARDGQFRWFGINPVDRLDRKWAKMRGQQLRLADHPAGRGALKVLGVEAEPVPRAMIKGYLFEPLDPGMEVSFPADVNPLGLRGWWTHRSDFESFRPRIELEGPLEWTILDKMRWMSPAHLEEGERLFSFDALASVLRRDRATMVAGLVARKEGHREVTRGVIVPDGWPFR